MRIKYENTVNQKEIIVINGLLKKAFGVTTKGNLMDYDRYPLPQQDELGFIAKGLPFPLFYSIIGKFTNSDGSELSVLPKFAEKAKKYAKLYEELIGKNVILIIDPRADNKNDFLNLLP